MALSTPITNKHTPQEAWESPMRPPITSPHLYRLRGMYPGWRGLNRRLTTTFTIASASHLTMRAFLGGGARASTEVLDKVGDLRKMSAQTTGGGKATPPLQAGMKATQVCPAMHLQGKVHLHVMSPRPPVCLTEAFPVREKEHPAFAYMTSTRFPPAPAYLTTINNSKSLTRKGLWTTGRRLAALPLAHPCAPCRKALSGGLPATDLFSCPSSPFLPDLKLAFSSLPDTPIPP